MRDLVLNYYSCLSEFLSSLSIPVRDLAEMIDLPLVSVLLFGIMGALAPCQVSTNIAALAFINRKVAPAEKTWPPLFAFIAGKLTVYTIVGGIVVALSLTINQVGDTVIPVVVIVRRALGPLLIVVGFFMIGLLKSRLSIGHGLSHWLEQKIGDQRGLLPTYLLGVAFSFAFCPTLFLLFFSLTVPLAIASPGGIVFPSVFAFGTALPLVCMGGVIATTRGNTGLVAKRLKMAGRWLQSATGVILILVGLHETLLYWVL
jgi:cytochrome c-type biogenesis protein